MKDSWQQSESVATRKTIKFADGSPDLLIIEAIRYFLALGCDIQTHQGNFEIVITFYDCSNSRINFDMMNFTNHIRKLNTAFTVA